MGARRAAGHVALVLAITSLAIAQTRTDPGRLRPANTQRATLSSGQVHRYQVAVTSVRFLSVVVEKNAIDLALAVIDPDGREVASSDNQSGAYGREYASAIADRPGSYTIEVKARGELKLSGSYAITLQPLHAPTSEDRLELQAESTLRDALVHDRAGDEKSLREAVGGYTRAAALFEQLTQPYLQALALNRLGIAWDGLHEPAKALEFYNQSLAIRRRIGDHAGEASTMSNLALISLRQGDTSKGLEVLNGALTLRRDMHDRVGEAASLFNLGIASSGCEALDYYSQALDIFRSVGDRRSEARTLKFIGNAAYDLGDKPKAVDSYGTALAVYRALGDAAGEATMLNYMATTCAELNQWQQALDYHAQSAPIFHALGDRGSEATALDSIGTIYNLHLIDKQKALDYYNQAVALRRADHDREGESDTLNNIGTVYSSLGQREEALEFFHQALSIRNDLHDNRGEAQTLENIGTLYSLLGDKRKALESYGQALAIQRAGGNRAGEANVLGNMAAAWGDLREQRKALDALNQALAIERSGNDKGAEASTLCNMGSVYSLMGEPQRALDLSTQALAIDREIHAPGQEAHALNVIGRIYSDEGEQQKALELCNQALPIARAAGDAGEEAASLHNIGRAYFVLGDTPRALDLYNRSLALYRAAHDRWDEARMLANLGNLYRDLGDSAKALELYGLAREIFNAGGDLAGEAGALNSLGSVWDDRGDKPKALDYYNRALSIRRAIGERASEAGTLNNMGAVYDSMGQKAKALELYEQALPILRAAGDREGEARVLANLRTLFAASQPDVAILFGKQAVNVLQSVRRANRGLEDSLRRSYERSIDSWYRNLAALLVERRRFAEAEEVLSLLKDREAGVFLQRDAVAAELRSATLLDSEKAALAHYEQLVGQVVALGEEKAALVAKSESEPLSAAERARSDQLDGDLGAAGVVLERFFDEEEKSFSVDSGAERRIAEMREAEGIQGSLAELGPGVVAIYTLVAPKKYVAMLVTPAARKAYTSPISESDLNAKIFAFRQKLEDPASDPLPLARELYRIVFPEGLREDLESMHAGTIMWSMDGALRYIPISALHDGHQYLVTRFRNSLITSASMDHLKDTPHSGWQGVGFGVSEAKAGFPALPSVPAELHSIFRQTGESAAPLAGSVRLDAEFTRSNFLNDLRQPNHRVVHIATHFDSRPLAANSYLLLGDGGRWSLQDIQAVPRLFSGVDLLTLSACSTAFTNRSEDGREVDSFGTIAQRLGARGVIASLWSVNDEATARLMETMYRLREANPELGKSEALRRAQRQMLGGTLRPSDATGETGRGVAPAKRVAAHDWTHPFYWAPFILIGNWK
jgi:CHAT domain-containing protein/tetratricopeptide (TPR) repeat protein